MASTFGKYAIEKKLGQGGMGAVYLALDPALNRRVALKVITSKDAYILERFQREAAAVAKLKHPNIVQVYEAGVINKQHYFTMDYIEGTSLDAIIKSKNKASLQNITKIILQTAAALHYAHQQNIVHRDIKPANIMIDKTGKVHIADFGLAKQLTGLDRSLTMSGTALGTPDYMPPEQAMGKKDEIDSRSDIFSLGATLYHCITGQVPFPGKEIYEVLSKVINDDPPAPSTIVRIIAKDLETICLKCLNKDKTRRYQTADALAQDLKRYLEGAQITAKRTSSITKIYLKLMKNKFASLSIIGAVVILAAVIIGLMTSSAGKKKEIESYRVKAESAFENKNYDESKTWCDKVLALASQDEKIQDLLKKSEEIIKAQEAKKQQEDKQVKEAVVKAQRTVDLRAEAKKILERANGAPTPDQKIKLAQDALEVDPTFGDAYQVIGYAYKEKAEPAKGKKPPDASLAKQPLDQVITRELYDKAFEYFSKAISATPTLAYSYYERALITEYTYNQPEKAIPDYRKVLELDPNSHIGWFAKGNIESKQKNYGESIKSYTKAIELCPEYEGAYNNRAINYGFINELDKAIADYNEAIRLNPQYIDARSNRARTYAMQGKFDLAITGHNETIRLDPENAKAYNYRGMTYHDIEELDQAIADFTQAIKLDPKLGNAYSNRGSAYRVQGEFDRAIADFDEAIRLDPKNISAYNGRGGTYAGKGEFDKAMADLNKALRLDPGYAQAYNNIGFAYCNKGEWDKAITNYNEAIRLDPKYARTYFNRGVTYIYKAKQESPGNNNSDIYRHLADKALGDFNESIRLNPRYAQVYIERGSIYVNRSLSALRQGENINQELADKAILDFTEAIRLNPKSAKAYCGRGIVYANKKEFRKAIADWERFLELAPNDTQAPEARQAIEDIKRQLEK
ncbi:MAG: tetratricopeptide repeat protein [Planctomycetota bacterium]